MTCWGFCCELDWETIGCIVFVCCACQTHSKTIMFTPVVRCCCENHQNTIMFTVWNSPNLEQLWTLGPLIDCRHSLEKYKKIKKKHFQYILFCRSENVKHICLKMRVLKLWNCMFGFWNLKLRYFWSFSTFQFLSFKAFV